MTGYSGKAEVKNPDVTERYVRVADILRRGTNWDQELPSDDDVAKLAQKLLRELKKHEDSFLDELRED